MIWHIFDFFYGNFLSDDSVIQPTLMKFLLKLRLNKNVGQSDNCKESAEVNK